MIQPSQFPQIPTIGVQSSTAYPVPYSLNPMPPGIGVNPMPSSMSVPSTMSISSSMPMPQSSLYPDAPPPYSLYASNPTLGALGSTLDSSSSYESRPRFPSAPSVESEKVLPAVIKM